jgi:hypothetical protein
MRKSIFRFTSSKSNLTAAGILLLGTVLFYWKILLTNQFSLPQHEWRVGRRREADGRPGT